MVDGLDVVSDDVEDWVPGGNWTTNVLPRSCVIGMGKERRIASGCGE